MKLFNWINPLWIMDNFLTTRFDPVTATAAYKHYRQWQHLVF
jgi:hypothetical protein